MCPIFFLPYHTSQEEDVRELPAGKVPGSWHGV
jgi:hypothetical protein